MDFFQLTITILTSSFAATLFSYLAARYRGKIDLKKLTEANKADIERLVKQHEVNLESIKEKHKMEMESKDKEQEYKLQIMQKEHELKAQEQKQSMTNNIATDAMSGMAKNLMQNPDEALKIMDNLLKLKEMSDKFSTQSNPQ